VARAKDRADDIGDRIEAVGIFGMLPPAALLVLIACLSVFTAEDRTDKWWNVVLLAAAALMQLLLSLFVVYCGRCLQRVRHHHLCVLGAVLVMLPFTSPCFPLGWIYGPIALFWLVQPWVRQAFALNRPDPDAAP
jgi:hypothetical protein